MASATKPMSLGSRWLEIAVAVVISFAGLGTSWATYQAALWSGVQAVRFGETEAYRLGATRAALANGTVQAWQVGLVRAWIEAKAAGNVRLATFYERRVPVEMKPAFNDWVALRPLDNPDAPPSPFSMPSYRQPALDEAQALEAKAARAFDEGRAANRTSDAFVRGAVTFAMAMFFGGIVQVFRGTGVRRGLVIMAIVVCLWGLERVLTLPTLALAPPVAVAPLATP